MNGIRFVISLATVAMCSTAAAQNRSAGDAARGATLFQERCALCHTPTGGQGPALGGIFGRPAAATPGFSFTKELRESKLTWNEATLDRFLANPTATVPGTTMVIGVPDAAERNHLIAFLRSMPAASTSATTTPVGTATDADDPQEWRKNAPGTKHRIALDQLPAPFATRSSGNFPRSGPRPANAELAVPKGFTVQPFSTNLTGPRVVRVAPNGDIFVAETRAGRIRVLRATDGATQPSQIETFAEGLTQPFGIVFYPLGASPQWVYIAGLNTVVRFPYKNGDLKARGAPETMVDKLTETTSGHSTRDIVFSKDGKRMLVSVGSSSNVAENLPAKTADEIREWENAHGLGASWGIETDRATVLSFDPQGKQRKVFATGIRNCVGLALHPVTGDPWCAVNERDALGDNLVPDYISSVREGAFYGWPWYYLGNNPDPRHKDTPRADLVGKITVPDLLLQPHSAALQLIFYTATKGNAVFPTEYRGDAFVALHGSWNRSKRTGYKIVRAFMKDNKPTGEYEDFLTGFVIDDSSVWGRPVGVAVARDGALLVSDDGSNTLWRIAYKK
jgi:glucose/arabinose dehydrogenase